MRPKLDKDADTKRLQLVVPETWEARVDEWRAKRRPIPNRSEAIRILVDLAISLDRNPDQAKEADR